MADPGRRPLDGAAGPDRSRRMAADLRRRPARSWSPADPRNCNRWDPGSGRPRSPSGTPAWPGCWCTAELAAVDRKAPPTVDAALWAVLNPADATDAAGPAAGRPLGPPGSGRRGRARRCRGPGRARSPGASPAGCPAGGDAGAPAPRPLWDQWATAAALPDCREMADLARSAIAGGDRGPRPPR